LYGRFLWEYLGEYAEHHLDSRCVTNQQAEVGEERSSRQIQADHKVQRDAKTDYFDGTLQQNTKREAELHPTIKSGGPSSLNDIRVTYLRNAGYQTTDVESTCLVKVGVAVLVMDHALVDLVRSARHCSCQNKIEMKK